MMKKNGMMKKTGILFLALALMLCSACSSGKKPDAQQMQTFYTAFNQLL
ncbi:MAG: internalin N-terminal domain-containing protein, partial [Erysipelotrichaceae bacterium]|nr:internalin N-terminal domain-containing protein [Erysipelotrichaceae bacterium]